MKKRYECLPAEHRHMLPTYLEHCSQLGKALDRNYKFVREMIGKSAGMFENSTISDAVSSLGSRECGDMIRQ